MGDVDMWLSTAVHELIGCRKGRITAELLLDDLLAHLNILLDCPEAKDPRDSYSARNVLYLSHIFDLLLILTQWYLSEEWLVEAVT